MKSIKEGIVRCMVILVIFAVLTIISYLGTALGVWIILTLLGLIGIEIAFSWTLAFAVWGVAFVLKLMFG